MNNKKKFKRTLSLFVTMSMLLPTVSSIGVFAATKKTSLVSAKATSATAVTLKWKKVSTVKGYEIYQKKAGEKYKKVKTIANKKTVSCKLSKLKSATKYTYKIRTYKTVKKKKQYSAFSSAKSVTTKPIAPSMTSAVLKGGEVTVQWKKVSGAKGYVVYIKTDKGNSKLKTTSSTSAKVKANKGDVLTARAYLTVSKKNIYSDYSNGITVVAETQETPFEPPIDNPENPTTPENNYVTEETLQKHIDELKDIFEKSYVTDEKVQEYLEELKTLFANSYVTQEQLDEYFNNIEESITSGFVTEEKVKEYLDELKTSMGTYEFVDITDDITIENCYYAHWNGEKLAYPNAQSCYMTVAPGEIFKVTGYSIYDVALALFYDGEGKVIDDKSYLNPDGKNYNNETVVIPEGCSYVAFGSFTSGLPHNLFLNVKKYKFVVDNNENNGKEKSVLYGKKMYADGDSVAEGGDNCTYVDFITVENVMSTNKRALSGTTLAVREGRTDSICERILSMDTTEKYDYILLEGGFNDMFLGIEIGEITNPHDFGGYYDRTTVIGAMETICHHLVNNYYESKKLFVLGHKCFGFWDSQIEYWDAIKSVLEKWGIPYVDLRKESNLCKRTEVDPIADKYFVNGDGIHPTEEAYKIFYVPLIKAKLEDL